MKKQVILFVLALPALAACGIVSDKAADYKKSSSTPSLEVPPDLVLQREQDMALPDVPKEVSYSTYENRSAEELRAAEKFSQPAGMELKRRADINWLVIKNISIQELWPRIKVFWQDVGFKLTREEPRLGILETNWLENRANIPQDIVRRTVGKALDFLYSSNTKDMFRVRVERSAEGVEVYLTHRGVEQVTQDEVFVWQSRPSDPELEVEMLKRLMVYLGAKKEQSQQQAEQVKKSGGATAELSESNGIFQVSLHKSFKEAWRHVGLGLDRANFTVEDRDREAGRYYVRYMGPAHKEEEGFFSKLAFWRDEDKLTERLYILHLQDEGSMTLIKLLNKDGQTEERGISERIMRILLEHL